MSIEIAADRRATHHRWLLELTQIPTAAGREGRVVAWIQRWVAERPGITLSSDAAGNLHLSMSNTRSGEPGSGEAPVYFTGHLDHPAFVVERVIGPDVVQLSFRGGVMDEYFRTARVAVHLGDAGERVGGVIEREVPSASGTSDKSYLVNLDRPSDRLRVGDVATWDLPAGEIRDGLIHTHACDDLAAVAAALAAYDELYGRRGELTQDVRLLFTRAEEIGFVGAIAACRERTMPLGSRVLALENSRSFAESPIGGGPIVRVGDRMSVFSPTLTAAVARRAEEISGGAATPTATQKQAQMPAWKWQRKLMAGGACEATVFCAYGYDATCLCLPLGNYHNMADLAAVQAGTNMTPPIVGREFVSIADFDGLVDLLVACGERLPTASPVMERIDKLWASRQGVLREA